MPVITATFDTRREAELAVEHLVQKHEVDRDDIVVGPRGSQNGVGIEPVGADAPIDFDDSDEEDAALAGTILVTVTVEDDDQAEEVRDFLEEFGGGDVAVGE